ncbi:centrosomal protein of 112 kDa isoform X2 [Rhinatrema bivittatum]|uniref:centrosomal protein of 112 kDa isoform X2 n=1 Tax=Rhinatrema bivittatum TaxID=194408 RepID=UPI001127EF0C|nr:centrosomal protein of 112 kDa isoform X2 [Rhinatrema bivittatum]
MGIPDAARQFPEAGSASLSVSGWKFKPFGRWGSKELRFGIAMSSSEETWEKLDAEFDHYLVDMKPYVLKLPFKPERQRCALWIKKLCDPSGAGTGFMGRKNRNMHAKLLLHMLKRGVLEGPFTHRPEAGILKTLPSYMSIYFDEPNSPKVYNSSPEGLPDWVMGELGSGDSKAEESWRLSEALALGIPIRTHRRQIQWRKGKDADREQGRVHEQLFQFKGKAETKLESQKRKRQRYTYRSQSMSPIRNSDEENLATQQEDHCKKVAAALDDSDIEARLNSWNLGIENPRYLREKPIPLSPISPKTSLGKSSFHDDQALFRIHEKELDMKTKIMETKFHEEKLKLQQKHDADVQKILDRKNNESEELKTLYRSKQNESEEIIRKLEKKVQTLVRESQVIRESKEKQIAELKKLCEQSTDSLKNEWEKKLHNAVAEMEKEKFELQKKHTENIQELLDDTNARLMKMEAEYVAQTKAINQMVRDLEARVQQLTLEAENSNLQRQKLSQEKTEVEKNYQTTCSELQEARARCSSVQKEMDRAIQDFEKKLHQLHKKYDLDMNFVKQEHALSAAKASDVIEELEQCVAQLKQQLQEAEHQRQQQLRDQESKFQQEILHLERVHEKKVHVLQSDLDKEKGSAQKKIQKLEEGLAEKEEQLTRVTEIQRLQAQQADAALEQFKRQVELNSEKIYAEMKQQMEKVEADLLKSKVLREKQSKEFALQIDELKQRYEQQIVELKLGHEQEKAYLFQQHNTEKDNLVRDHEREIEKLDKQFRITMEEHENKTKAWRKQDSQTICDLENQMHMLREELIQVNSQRKQQLVELGLLREDEKQKAAREHETALNKLKTEMEKMKMDLQKKHASETEITLEKVIAELQTTISSLREENCRQQRTAEKQLQDALQKFEEEKRMLMKDNDRAVKVLQDEIENCCSQLRTLEKKLQNKDLEIQEQITQIRQTYEMKLKGLMPMSLRQELEDTISSLKSQVTFLQKRACVLQEDLDSYQNRR